MRKTKGVLFDIAIPLRLISFSEGQKVAGEPNLPTSYVTRWDSNDICTLNLAPNDKRESGTRGRSIGHLAFDTHTPPSSIKRLAEGGASVSGTQLPMGHTGLRIEKISI